MLEPKPLLVQASVRMQKVFSKRYTVITQRLEKTLNYNSNPEFSIISLYLILKFIEREFNQLDKEIENKVTDEIEYAYYLGFAFGLMSYYEGIGVKYTFESVMKEVPFMVDKTVLIGIKNVTMKDLLQVTKNTEFTTKRFIQDIMTKHLNVKNMKNMGRQELADIIIKDLTGKKLQKAIQSNMIAVVDKAGRQWRTENYVDMVVQTKAHQVYVQGIKDFATKNEGNGDLAKIPYNSLTTDACKQFQGMTISMTGMTAGYRTYDELKATGLIFHPRCRHFPVPIPKKE